MGGKVFNGTNDFDHNAIEELLDLVNNKILKNTGIECIPVGSAATPTPGKRSGDLDVIVDEKSVDWCVSMGLEVIKVASSDINDWFLLQKIAKTKHFTALNVKAIRTIMSVVRVVCAGIMTQKTYLINITK